MRIGRWGGACALVIAIFFGDVRAAFILPQFGTATVMTPLNSTYNDYGTWVSGDGLTFVMQSGRNLTGNQLFSASRAATSSPFSTPSTAEFSNLNGTVQNIRNGVMSV